MAKIKYSTLVAQKPDTAKAINEALGVAVNVKHYGAVGDGVTDDSIAIQAAIDATTNGGILMLNHGQKYYVSAALIVDTSKIRAIQGNNAAIIIDGDYNALNITGSLTSGTADPSNNQTRKLTEFNFLLHGLRIYHASDGYVGTGIKIAGTMGLKISSCLITGIGTGIKVEGINRNMIIEGCNLYDIGSYCVHIDSNIHQFNFFGNHVSYAGLKTFYVSNSGTSDIANFQIVGNDFEESDTSGFIASNIIHFDIASSGEIIISDNTIQGHETVSDALIRFASGLTKVTISNNLLTMSAGDAIATGNASMFSINNNTIYGCTGYAVNVSGSVGGVNINNNNIENTKGIRVTAGAISLLNITYNNMRTIIGDGIYVLTSNNYLTNLNISGNHVFLLENRDITVLTYGILVDAGTSYLNYAFVKDNNVWGYWTNGDYLWGIKVVATSYEHLVANCNMVKNAEGAAFCYDIPVAVANNIVNADNIYSP